MKKEKVKKQCLLSIASCLMIFSSAQDLKLSQYKMAPTFYNPANTGNFNGTFRGASIYSNQKTDSATLNHAVVFGDYKIEQERGSVGLGVSYYQNFQQNFRLTSKYLSAAIAKHFYLDEDKYHMLSFGAQITFASATIDPARTNYSKTIAGGGFDMVGTAESTFDRFIDFNLGAMYTYKDEEITIQAGLGAYHVFMPDVSLTNIPTKQERRLDFSVKTIITLDVDNELELSTMLWGEELDLVGQKPAYVETLFNASLERFVGETSAIYLGMGTRSLKSITPLFGFSINNNALRIIASYERPINTSLYNVTRGELSMMVTF